MPFVESAPISEIDQSKIEAGNGVSESKESTDLLRCEQELKEAETARQLADEELYRICEVMLHQSEKDLDTLGKSYREAREKCEEAQRRYLNAHTRRFEAFLRANGHDPEKGGIIRMQLE